MIGYRWVGNDTVYEVKEIKSEGWKGGWVEGERGMSKVKVKVHLI